MLARKKYGNKIVLKMGGFLESKHFKDEKWGSWDSLRIWNLEKTFENEVRKLSLK